MVIHECWGFVNREKQESPAAVSAKVPITPPWKKPWCCSAKGALGILSVTEPWLISDIYVPKWVNIICFLKISWTNCLPITVAGFIKVAIK